MTCKIFTALWTKSHRGNALLERNHAYSVGTDGAPRFVRIDEYQAAEPPIRNAPPCKCGEPDAWRCWSLVYTKELLAQARIMRTGRGYTVYPEDPAINAAILGAANKMCPTGLDERGIPTNEDFRDLCSHLRLDGLETMANGNVSTAFLAQSAAKYLRGNNAAQSLTQHMKENRRTRKR